MLVPNLPADETFAMQTVHGDTFSVPMVVVQRYREQNNGLRKSEMQRRAAISKMSQIKLGKMKS